MKKKKLNHINNRIFGNVASSTLYGFVNCLMYFILTLMHPKFNKFGNTNPSS